MKRLGLALLLCAAPGAAAAQGTAVNGTITALVIGGPITFLNLQNLNFATVTRGVPKTVVQNTAFAGKVRVAGQPNAFTQIRFTLPTPLPNIQAAPGIEGGGNGEQEAEPTTSRTAARSSTPRWA